MSSQEQDLIKLETRFWQSMVDRDPSVAVGLLSEPAVMVSSHGAMQFDHAGYRKMADHGAMVVKSFEFDDMQVVFPNPSTAILTYSVRQGVAPRGKGAGRPSCPPIHPGRGEVSAKSFSHTSICARASIPRIISPNCSTRRQISGCGPPWISP